MPTAGPRRVLGRHRRAFAVSFPGVVQGISSQAAIACIIEERGIHVGPVQRLLFHTVRVPEREISSKGGTKSTDCRTHTPVRRSARACAYRPANTTPVGERQTAADLTDRKVFTVWSAADMTGEMAAIMATRARSDVNESFRMSVNLDARKGMWVFWVSMALRAHDRAGATTNRASLGHPHALHTAHSPAKHLRQYRAAPYPPNALLQSQQTLVDFSAFHAALAVVVPGVCGALAARKIHERELACKATESRA